ncbi:MAG TPA: hypothetical protein VEA80_10805 [Vitreimonas sp.]|uniref:hypothetical protein n=1 Tax=Vitreimonas sp. TaxID=3069702 RepID=UPI002D4E662B|nr:hypothetical protein [Vitreimonas sp.]HYD87956.1 hypothetical protein [Vitreimonas sp.]
MRRFVLAAAALLLSACGRSDDAESINSECALSATREVAWSRAQTPDVITTSAQGPSCAQAAVTFVARNADGDPLWVFSSTYHDLTVGGGFPPEGAPEVTREQMESFLTTWADVTASRTSGLPEWREGAPSLTASATTFVYETPYDRETYEMLRARDLPMICYAAAPEATQCLIIDPTSHAPALMVAYE